MNQKILTKNLYRLTIDTVFKMKFFRNELDHFVERSVSIINLMNNSDLREEKAILKLIKLIFKKRWNISKLKLKFDGPPKIEIDNTGIFIILNGTSNEGHESENIRIEIEILDYKIVVNIVFMDTGEIRQSDWRADGVT